MIGSLLGWFGDPAHWAGPDGVPARLAEHAGYAGAAVLVAVLLGVPVGALVGHARRGTAAVAAVANALRALPTMGLLVLLVIVAAPRLPGDAVYWVPTEVVLVVLAVPPVLTSTCAGIGTTPAAALDAARGMGMTGRQVLWRVELPCALPLVVSGVRGAVLQTVATATLAAYVSLGGLGRYLVDGLAVHDYPRMAAGALLVAGLALTCDLVLLQLQRYLHRWR